MAMLYVNFVAANVSKNFLRCFLSVNVKWPNSCLCCIIEFFNGVINDTRISSCELLFGQIVADIFLS